MAMSAARQPHLVDDRFLLGLSLTRSMPQGKSVGSAIASLVQPRPVVFRLHQSSSFPREFPLQPEDLEAQFMLVFESEQLEEREVPKR